jgi:hypothetical protein
MLPLAIDEAIVCPAVDTATAAAAVAGGGGADGLNAPPAMVDPGADPLTSVA